MPELNQNIAASAGASAVASSAAGVPASPLQPAVAGAINEQMSRSMHEARNQIFDSHDNQLGEQQQQRRRQRVREQAKSPAGGGASASGSVALDKPQPQIAFALDPHYNVLWVYDGGARKLLCYNVLASEIANCGAVSGEVIFLNFS